MKGKNNGYLARQALRDGIIKEATRQTFVQYMTDMLVITLNDPAVMGKDVFGRERIKRVVEAQGKYYDTFFESLTNANESDYLRAKIDEAIKRILGEDNFVPFIERYDWISEIEYKKGEYGKVKKKRRD